MKEDVSNCFKFDISVSSLWLRQWFYVKLSWRIKAGSGNLLTTLREYLGQIYSLPLVI